MPWGWECRAKLVKQLPAKPAERRGAISGDAAAPGPQQYETPQIFCGNGFSKIQRAPAYTFGHLTPVTFSKPVAKPFAPLFNIRGLGRKGEYKIKHGVVGCAVEAPGDKTKAPGPAAYAPRVAARFKRPPAFSCRIAARPPYQPWDQWTPPPNMYCPPIPCKRVPAYSFGYVARDLRPQDFPGPGEHEPKFNFPKNTKPAYTFGGPYKRPRPYKTPPPNHYCERKFMVGKRTIPAPSFGIRHTPYLGKHEVYLRSSKLDLVLGND